ncbi:MAG: phosphoribosylglycinamide formyltransferase, partial [FCB group bacterium]|nr:phosphoribosylglycinamide formyltransferase [FCB group bacterium]
MADKLRLAVFLSGGGSNLQSIIDKCVDGYIPAEVALVVSSTRKAFGLTRAEKAGIEGVVYRRKNFPDGKTADTWLVNLLDDHKIDFIALAGYLKMLPPPVVKAFKGRIYNI